MDFTFTDEQEAVRDLAGRIFEDRATVERVKAVEASDERVDRELWAELARANLLGIAVPEEHGGSGLGLIELCLALEQQGRFRCGGGGGGGTDRSIQSHLALSGAPAEQVGDDGAVGWLLERTLVGLCAVQVGVCEQALRLAAEYTSHREQFGRPLSTFQGVALKAADAYIDTEALRTTTWQAAWRLAEGLDASREVLVAKWWAAEGGQRAVHITQHLHGGLGADVDYPVHRYFLWGKQIETTLGGAGHQ